MIKINSSILFLFIFINISAWGITPKTSRVTSIFLSEHFINEQLKTHVKSGLLKNLSVQLDAKNDQVFLRGVVEIPIEELRAVNLDPSMRAYHFQVTIKPEATAEGHLILEFPLNQTYFYPSNSAKPLQDKVVIPVQMLSLALATTRGYLAGLSGDFSALDRKQAKLNTVIKSLNKSIAKEKDNNVKESLINERDTIKLQLAAIPIERKQMKAANKALESLLGFTGEKELNLNERFSARQNALILKLNLANFTPYLKGVELGGIRIVHDKKDGGISGENYFAIDINAQLAQSISNPTDGNASEEEGLKIAPSAIIKIKQELFESDLVVNSEKKAVGSKLRDLKIEFKKDGLHVSGKYHKFFINIPFDTIVDFETSDKLPDTIDVSVRDIEVGGIDLEFMTGFILEAMKFRLDQTLKGICTFEYLGEKADNSRVLRVHLAPAALIPALPGQHLVDLEIRDGEFLFKIGYQ